ncbi:ribose 5-phosphate isomerase A [Acidianus sulfidivorans JP7]|uniref:Ribose 5-phosphate isomerase A n=1 Tax=Acidianus sulfidivorans JP7 TaxID=619593 RepID=A0A2U9IML8_9CREN|nr:ribose 5-phosphate isomerase A [Acidianus sulfidivorans]AWR97235.1 ribose 5-phosphate isomerase A [Acidianus sulfidivorans JP7]
MDAKEILAKKAIEYLMKFNIIGIGTGKTARKLIEEIKNNKNSFLAKNYIASSIDSEIQLSSNGFNVLSLFSGVIPDIYVDSFDYLIFNEQKREIVMIKGGGGALMREKLLSYNAKYRLFIGEFNKVISKDSYTIKIPIEVVPVAVNYVLRSLESMNLKGEIRSGTSKIGPVISDNGNILIDITITKKEDDLCKLDSEIHNIIGVIETGIFCNKLYDTIILADDNGKLEIIKKS